MWNDWYNKGENGIDERTFIVFVTILPFSIRKEIYFGWICKMAWHFEIILQSEGKAVCLKSFFYQRMEQNNKNELTSKQLSRNFHWNVLFSHTMRVESHLSLKMCTCCTICICS